MTDSTAKSEIARRQYRYPPIEEAICDIRFTDSKEWDPTVPGAIYQELIDEYPAKPQSENTTEAEGSFSEEEGNSHVKLQFRYDANIVRFTSEDGRRIVRVGPDRMTVHLLKPYTSWEDYRGQIYRALEPYRRVTEPSAISQIGVRYINRIIVEADVVELSQYFTSPPHPPQELPQSLDAFVVRISAMYDDPSIRLVTTFASESSPNSDESSFILDIDVIGQWPDTLPFERAAEYIEDLRIKERLAFEALITERARKIFDAKQNY